MDSSHKPQDGIPPTTAPLLSSFNTHIRPLLDAVDELRRLDVMKEGIALPTIVVVGDQSHGKSSVLESLAGISLPRGQSICTRVPLIMRMLSHSDPTPQFHLQYLDKVVPTSEDLVATAIATATKEIAGDGNGVSDVPLTLIVKKKGVPDLTMIDLPGIVRVAVEGQPEDICDRIQGMIKEYIAPKESIILNVLPATADFATCGSIAMSQSADRTGERTLAVVTKCDVAPEGLYEKITANVVNIALGYVCVRNRVGEESFEEARKKEELLFRSNPLLSRIDQSMVGIQALAKKLMELQAIGIGKCFPDIVRKTDLILHQRESELKMIPQSLTNPKDVLAALVQILVETKKSLSDVLLKGESDEFRDDNSLHCPARLVEMLGKSFSELKAKQLNADISPNSFLKEEIATLQELKGFELPNFLPSRAFLQILRKKLRDVAHIPTELIQKVWEQIEHVATHVVSQHSRDYPQLQSAMTAAISTLISKLKDGSYQHVKELIEMEMLMSYTFDPKYVETCNRLLAQQNTFLQTVGNRYPLSSVVDLQGIGKVDVGHLRDYTVIAGQAFDLRMRILAYWDVVILRLIDNLAFHFRYYMERLVNKEFEEGVMNELVDAEMNGIQDLLKEPPAISKKRAELKTTIEKLKRSKFIIKKVTCKL